MVNTDGLTYALGILGSHAQGMDDLVNEALDHATDAVDALEDAVLDRDGALDTLAELRGVQMYRLPSSDDTVYRTEAVWPGTTIHIWAPKEGE